MPRLPRAFVEGIPVHVTLRGVDRQDVFRTDGDRTRFLDVLKEASVRAGVSIHAYVLMTNHVHLLATPRGSDSFSNAIQHLGRRYVAYFNRRHERTGTLWEGRYRAGLVGTSFHLLACHRYIELNPVRARMVSFAADYPWSSYRSNAWGSDDEVLTPHDEYVALGETSDARRAAYRALFEEVLQESVLEQIRAASRHGWSIGSEESCRLLEHRTGLNLTPRRRGPAGRRNRADPK